MDFLIWTNNFDLYSQDFYDFVALFQSVLKGIIPHLLKREKKREEKVLPWTLGVYVLSVKVKLERCMWRCEHQKFGLPLINLQCTILLIVFTWTKTLSELNYKRLWRVKTSSFSVRNGSILSGILTKLMKALQFFLGI